MKASRSLVFLVVPLVSLAGLGQGCGGESDGALPASGGSAGASAGHGGSGGSGGSAGSTSSGGSGASGGSTSSGGSGATGGGTSNGGSGATGGSSSGSGGATGATGGTGGGAAGSGGEGAGSGGEPADTFDCDLRKVVCRRAEPVCPEMQVPSVEGTCYGDCVPIGECRCTEAEDCPHEETYTCHRSAMRCGPYVG